MSSSLGIRSIRQRLYATALAQQRRSRLERHVTTTTRSAAAALWTPGHCHQNHPIVRQTSSSRPSFYHSSTVIMEEAEASEKELSPKEKKKLLKAKAKAAAAAAEKEEDAAADKKKALQEKLAAKKAAATGEEAASPAAESTPPPPEEEKAAAEPPSPEVAAATTADEPSQAASSDSSSSEPAQYSTPELAADAAKHKAGLDDPEVPFFQNPLHHNNPDNSKIFREDFDSDEAFEAAKQPAPPLDLGDGNVAAPEYLQALADEMVNLSMLEMNELVNKIAHHYGFDESMLSPDDDGGGGDEDDDGEEGDAPKEETKTSFDIKLVEFDAKAKIKVIKEVRALAGLGLKEAKELVEGAPKVVHKGVKKEEADEIKAKLEEIGATVEIV